MVRSINLFLAHQTFRDTMGGSARRGVLFEGPPGTGKTFVAKAMAKEANVPFLFVSASAFQSMYYGQTNRKIRSFFKQLRKHARKEGGAIGFIEEIDAIGATRRGMGGSGGTEGVSGVVNELLVQLQSFDTPTRGQRFAWAWIDLLNRYLPDGSKLHKPAVVPANVLVVGATNRKDDLDPALIRPGRFDRTIYFGLPGRRARADIVAYYLGKKAHAADLDEHGAVDIVAGMTFGYSPAALERLMDEALVIALTHGRSAMTMSDVAEAKMLVELGVTDETIYTPERARPGGHPRGRPRHRGLLRGPDAPARRALHRQAPRLARPAAALRHRGALHQEQRGAARAAADRHGRHGGRGALVRRGVDRPGLRPGRRHRHRGADDRRLRHGHLAHLGRRRRQRLPRGQPGRQGARATRTARAELDTLLMGSCDAAKDIVTTHPEVVEALRDALLERDELVGSEITEVIEAALHAPEPAAIAELPPVRTAGGLA